MRARHRVGRVPIIVLLASSAVTYGAGDAAGLRERFDRMVIPAVEDAASRELTNAAGGIAWGHSYTLAALVEMLDATGDAKYAELFVRLADRIERARDTNHARRDQVRDKVLPAWGSTKYSAGKHYVWAVHTGMVAEPLARFTTIVARYPALEAKYAPTAEGFLKVAREAIAAHDDQFRDGPGEGEGHLYGLYTERQLPLNMQNALVRAWIALDDATGRREHREHVEKLARFMKNRFRIEQDVYVWDYRPPLEGPGAGYEDISHAAINVDLAVKCAQREIVFTREDLQRLERTLLQNVLAGDGRIADRVGGPPAFDKYRPAALQWASLARTSPRVRDVLTKLALRDEFAEGPNSVPLALARLFAAHRSAPASVPQSHR